MGKKLIYFLLLSFSLPKLQGQLSVIGRVNHLFSFELQANVMAGYWLYNRGSTADSIYNDRGFDRTRYAPYDALQLSVRIAPHPRWELGLCGFFGALVENEMEQMEHTWTRPRGYRISEGKFVSYEGLMLQGQFDLLRRAKSSLYLSAAGGTFAIQTVHPRGDSIGLKFCWQAGLSQAWALSKKTWFKIGLLYQEFQMRPEQSPWFREKHSMHYLGFSGALCWNFKRISRKSHTNVF